MLGRRMLGALLVLVGIFSFFWGGIVLVVEATTVPVYPSIATPTSADPSLLLLGIGLTLAGGIVLLLRSAREAV